MRLFLFLVTIGLAGVGLGYLLSEQGVPWWGIAPLVVLLALLDSLYLYGASRSDE